MALPYVPVPFPSFVYPSSSTEPARTVQSATELATLNASLASMGSSVSFTGTPTVVPKPAATVPVKTSTVNGQAHQKIQDRMLKDA